MLSVKLEKFEGPLDLLLHLIEKNKVSIYDIPIIQITEQYMEYIRELEKRDLELVSDFLLMAATLLDIKARMMLPAQKDENGEEIDPREELVERLAEYKLYKSLAKELSLSQEDADRLFYREPNIPKEVSAYQEPVDVEKLLNGITLQNLEDIFRMVMKRQVDKLDPIRSSFGTIKKEPVKLSDRIRFLLQYYEKGHSFSFRGLLESQDSKETIVVTFLACLELIRMGQITASQESVADDIFFEWNEENRKALSGEELELYDENL